MQLKLTYGFLPEQNYAKCSNLDFIFFSIGLRYLWYTSGVNRRKKLTLMILRT